MNETGNYFLKINRITIINQSIIQGEEHFLLSDTTIENHRVIIFVTDRSLRLLAEAKRRNADRTFECAPKFFFQLYLLHAFYKEHMFPSVFCLMSCKSKALYKHFLREVKEAALRIRVKLRPEFILTDCEIAAIKVFEFHFPNANNKICLFYYEQAIFLKFVELGFKCDYEN